VFVSNVCQNAKSTFFCTFFFPMIMRAICQIGNIFEWCKILKPFEFSFVNHTDTAAFVEHHTTGTQHLEDPPVTSHHAYHSIMCDIKDNSSRQYLGDPMQHPLTHITQSCVESKATHQNKYCSNQQVHTCHTHSQEIAVACTQWQCRTYKERLADIFLI
jgi:hypothetical protein